MHAFSPPKVLILAQTPESARQWAEMLAGDAAEIWLSASEVPPGAEMDVVVSDLASPEAAAEQAGLALHDSPDGPRLPAALGVVGIGAVGIGAGGIGAVGIERGDWADVRLPADFSRRELALACRLVAEIARLRARETRSLAVRKEADELAYLDPLTGLANRRAWDRQFPLNRQAARLAGKQFWLAIVDLDDFKRINDTCGMLAGDEVLRAAAQALANQLRRDDLIARLGGDEFAVLLVGADESNVRGVFARLLGAMRGISLPPGAAVLSASIGYATPRADETTDELKELFLAAERALRQAKQAGGDRACGSEGKAT